MDPETGSDPVPVSRHFTEAIWLRKYPEYAQYQARVSRLVPWPQRDRQAS